MFQFGLISLINSPTRVVKNSFSAIDHIMTNLIDKKCETGIIKTDLSDHFPIFVNFDLKEPTPNKKTENDFFYKRSFDETSINKFKMRLKEVNWTILDSLENPCKAFDRFMEIIGNLYEESFPNKEVKTKHKKTSNPWITNGILKSSKRKQKLYEKFLKNRTTENESIYKTYKNLFETIKRKSKKNYYSELLLKYRNDAKRTWNVMKNIIGKSKSYKSNFPQKIIVDDKEVSEIGKIAEEFNIFFTKVGPSLAEKTPKASKSFDSYLKNIDSIMPTKPISTNELKEAFFSLKINKTPGYDDINFNIIKKCFGELLSPLKFLFNRSLEKGIFPDSLKIAKGTPIFKSGDKTDLNNYRPISVLPCFSKMLERIMYNRLYKYLLDNDILYRKQFGFQIGQSTDHAILELADQIYDSFDKNLFTLGVFIDLSKAFDTVDHSILIKKLQIYGVLGSNISWIRSYLSNRKQFIQISPTEKTDFQTVKCGVPQGSILGPLLFLIYVNDLQQSSKLLNPIMFADDTNLFYSHENIFQLFSKVNFELSEINQWFNANKLSLNVTKTKYSFFHKPSIKDKIPLQLPKLFIDNYEVKRKNSIKFLGILLDENLTWKEHIKFTENKIAKNIGILFKAKPYLNKECMLSLYFSYIHSYINYGSIAWASTNKSNLAKILKQQKHAIRIIFNKNRFDHTKELFRSNKILNIYQLNILKNTVFMQQVNIKSAPKVFYSKFLKPSHPYPTNFSNSNYIQPFTKLNLCKFRISYRGPYLWNNLLNYKEKQIQNTEDFKKKVKFTLLSVENETDYF